MKCLLLPSFQVNQLLLNSDKLKHEVVRNILLSLFVFNVFSVKQ